MPILTNTRPEAARQSSSTAPSWWRTRPIPAHCQAWCCGAIATAESPENEPEPGFQAHVLHAFGTSAVAPGFFRYEFVEGLSEICGGMPSLGPGRHDRAAAETSARDGTSLGGPGGCRRARKPALGRDDFSSN